MFYGTEEVANTNNNEKITQIVLEILIITSKMIKKQNK